MTVLVIHGIIERMFDTETPFEFQATELAEMAGIHGRLEDLDRLDDEQLTHSFEELTTSIERLQVEADRRLVEIDRRRAYQRDGYTSTVAYLTHRLKTAPGRAMRSLSDARTLETMSQTRDLAADGKISRDQTKVLINAKQAAPDHFDNSEEMLSAFALEMAWVSDLKKAATYWKHSTQSLDPHLTMREQQERSYLFISQTFDGMVKLDGLLDADRGTRIIEAVRAATPPPIDGERSTPASRRAQALADLVSSTGHQPNKPTVLVHVDGDTLKGAAHTLAEIGDSVLTPEQIDQITCDANFRRVVFGPKSEVVDVGRKKRLLSDLIREALVARDRGCRFPGCDRPTEWCDAHHIKHWKDGGETTFRAIASSYAADITR